MTLFFRGRHGPARLHYTPTARVNRAPGLGKTGNLAGSREGTGVRRAGVGRRLTRRSAPIGLVVIQAAPWQSSRRPSSQYATPSSIARASKKMSADRNTPRLYDDLAWLWPMWGSAEEYADYCGHAMRLIRAHTQIPVHSMLDLGCGGGKNVFHLKRCCAVTGLDLSPRMLELARRFHPECEFVQGDMRSLDLGRSFDAVFVDDAISYMTTRADLQSVFAAAWLHLKPGGVMIVTPDETKETFVQNRTAATVAAETTKPADLDVVFVENNYDPDPEDDHYEATMVYLIRQQGKLRVETDRHLLGLFPLAVWRQMLMDAGFQTHEAMYSECGTEYLTFAGLKSS